MISNNNSSIDSMRYKIDQAEKAQKKFNELRSCTEFSKLDIEFAYDINPNWTEKSDLKL